MIIRRANENDIKDIINLLKQVLEIHYNIRPDLFVKGTTKYNEEELKNIINDNQKPIYVYDEDNVVIGYCFCIVKEQMANNNMTYNKTLYIDDLCVDENSRNKHIGQQLLDYIKNDAKNNDFDYITLNVWEGNSQAINFYKKNGFNTRKYEMDYKLK